MKSEPLALRLFNLSVCDPVTDCWVWIGATIINRAGKRYGAIKVAGKRQLAHRVAFEVFKGRKLPRKKVGAHLCNNSLCINPDHLDEQTQKKNMGYAAACERMYRQKKWENPAMCQSVSIVEQY